VAFVARPVGRLIKSVLGPRTCDVQESVFQPYLTYIQKKGNFFKILRPLGLTTVTILKIFMHSLEEKKRKRN